MKYTLLPVYYISQQPSTTSYFKVPLMCSDYIYGKTPNAGDPDLLLAEGSSLGYTDPKNMYKEIYNALKFNPFKCRDYYLSTGADDFDLIPEVIKAFNGSYSINNTNFGGCYVPNTVDSDHLVGYNNLSTEFGDVRGTNGLTQLGILNPYLNLLSLMSPYRELEENDGFIYRFCVGPESYINKGYLNFSGFKTHQGNFRWCVVKLYVYHTEEIVESINVWRYFWYIKIEGYTASGTETQSLLLRYQGLELPEKIYDTDDPNGTNQPNGNEGGDGEDDGDGDNIPPPDLPTIDVTALGGIKLYRCSNTDIAALFAYLFSHDPGDAVLKWFTNPIQSIMACYYLPYPVPVITGQNITVLGLDTGVSAYKAEPWTKWDLGACQLKYGFENQFLDYSPFSKLKIYLPFIGVRDLNIDECVGKSIGVVYEFDNISGACVAFVTVNSTVRYSFTGSCAIGIPIAQSNWGQFYMAAATTAASMLSGGVAGAAGAIAQGSGVGGVALGAASGAVEAGGGLSGLSAKPTISRSGAVSGAGAALGIEHPFLIVERPDKANVSNPRPVIGVPSGRTLSLGSLSGYNIIEHVHLSGIAATGPELEEIERLLYEGVMF